MQSPVVVWLFSQAEERARRQWPLPARRFGLEAVGRDGSTVVIEIAIDLRLGVSRESESPDRQWFRSYPDRGDLSIERGRK